MNIIDLVDAMFKEIEGYGWYSLASKNRIYRESYFVTSLRYCMNNDLDYLLFVKTVVKKEPNLARPLFVYLNDKRFIVTEKEIVASKIIVEELGKLMVLI